MAERIAGASSVAAVRTPVDAREIPMSRARGARWVLPLVLAAVALAGCSVPSNAPEGYGDSVQEFFVQGCTGEVPETDGTTTTLASSQACAPCAYDVFTEQVPYDDDARQEEAYAGYPADAPTFEDLNGDLNDDPDALDRLPAEVLADLDRCVGAGGDGGTSGEPSEASGSDGDGEG